MDHTILHHGQPCGQVHLKQVQGGVQLQATCTLQTDAILRLYGESPNGTAIKIGVLEPQNGNLVCNRLLTYGWLTAQGDLPIAYHIEGQESTPTLPHHIGDAVVEHILRDPTVAYTATAQGLLFPFVVGQQTPFACCLTACTVQNGMATLYIPPKTGQNDTMR